MNPADQYENRPGFGTGWRACILSSAPEPTRPGLTGPLTRRGSESPQDSESSSRTDRDHTDRGKSKLSDLNPTASVTAPEIRSRPGRKSE